MSLITKILNFSLLLWTLSVTSHEFDLAKLDWQQLEPHQAQLRWTVKLEDLLWYIEFDHNQDLEIQWQEVTSSRFLLDQVLQQQFVVNQQTQQCAIETQQLDWQPQGKYLFVDILISCPQAITQFDYLFLQQINPQHKLIVTLHQDKQKVTHLLNTQRHTLQLDTVDFTAPHQFNLLTFIKEGIIHILIGLDHLAFIMLLVFAALHPKVHFSETNTRFIYLLKLITTFTIAHSITIALSYLTGFTFPSHIVEPIIALTVLVTALTLLWRPSTQSYLTIFVFGLFHGMGFGSVLSELYPVSASDTVSFSLLFGFNIGIEFGQIVFALLVCLLLLVLRRLRIQLQAIQLGSSAIAGIGIIWIIERVFAISLIS